MQTQAAPSGSQENPVLPRAGRRLAIIPEAQWLCQFLRPAEYGG
jgi:hypothetical protein